ncbi:uncharacterized protein [Lolium perenne]|uniref:uncharacterized protein isoform X9 n=1 Tax=Lolium perenne TaxID=4522 RepID=UPI003A9A276B
MPNERLPGSLPDDHLRARKARGTGAGQSYRANQYGTGLGLDLEPYSRAHPAPQRFDRQLTENASIVFPADQTDVDNEDPDTAATAPDLNVDNAIVGADTGKAHVEYPLRTWADDDDGDDCASWRYWRTLPLLLLAAAKSRNLQPGSVPAQELVQQQLHHQSAPSLPAANLLAEIRTLPQGTTYVLREQLSILQAWNICW